MDEYAVALRRINQRKRVGQTLLVTAKSCHYTTDLFYSIRKCVGSTDRFGTATEKG